MNKYRFNAAQRLLELILKLKSVANNKKTWEAYLEVSEWGTTKGDALLFAFELAKLANEVENTIKNNENVEDILLGSISQILTLCRELNLEAQWAQYTNRITEPAIVALKAYGAFFENVCSEKKISDEDFKIITDNLNELNEAILSIENEELREILLSITESVHRATFLYRVSGAKAFTETFDLSVGKLIISYKRASFNTDNEQDDHILKKTWALITTISNIASKTNDILSLPHNVVKAIGILDS